MDDDLDEPDEDSLKAVLGKKHDVVEDQYTDEQLKYFDAYNSRFKLGSNGQSFFFERAFVSPELRPPGSQESDVTWFGARDLPA